jgi:ATP-dependent exoDNAse (exonuclease V) alpha subunit
VDGVDGPAGGRAHLVDERGPGDGRGGAAKAYNIGQFLGRLEDGGSRGAMRIARDDVLVIDEASQISTTDLAAIQAVATAAGARIVLAGDTAQLGAVETGGMMRLIAGDLGHWELAEVRRFDAEWERLASVALRRGDRAAIRAVLFAVSAGCGAAVLQQPGRPE